jgi:O-antigen ligase
MRKVFHKGMFKGKIKLLYLIGTVAIFTAYLIYAYNSIKNRSHIYEPVYITIQCSIPEKTSLELSYQTIIDPTLVTKVDPIAIDSISANTYIFKIDSTYRLQNFSIYFRSLRQDKEIIISSIKASNAENREVSFSLERKDLIPSGNLYIDQPDHGAIRIRKVAQESSAVASLYFYANTLHNSVLVKTDHKEAVFPSLIAFLSILFLGVCLFYCLHPLISRLNWSGISPGAYLLALAILILPTGEMVVNLLLFLAILMGFIHGTLRGTFRNWTSQNRGLLLIIVVLIFIYLIAFLTNSSDPSNQKLLKIKYCLPLILLAIAVNTNLKQEICLHYVALITGVLISIFMHFGWAVMLIDGAEIKNKLFANPQYYLESTVFSRIHHSYLSVLYLASLTFLHFKRDILAIRKKEIIILSLLIITGLIFAFSRAAILSLLLILIYFSLKWSFHLLKFEISHRGRFLAAALTSICLTILVLVDIRIDPTTENPAVRGLSTRMDIWTHAVDLIKQKPITGWGPGNYKYALLESNYASSFNINRWKVLNTHNQFLETAGMFGLPAALVLIWFLFYPTGFSRQSVKQSDFIITAALIFVTAFFFESMLNRNLGVLYFGLYYGLLIKTKMIYGR